MYVKCGMYRQVQVSVCKQLNLKPNLHKDIRKM